MSSSRRPVGFWVSAWLPVVMGVVVIVIESTATFGANRTAGPIRWLLQLIFGRLSDSTFDTIHHIVRKSGHFVGYGLISLTWLRAWRMTNPGRRFFAHAALALLGTGLLASWDEWHQSFLPNRGSSPWDVLLDCVGASAMLLLTFFYVRIRRRERLTMAA
jgi:VanZ family protein